MDEFGFIASLLSPLAAGEVGALGLEDDAAIISVPPGYELIVTKDVLTQGVHFIGDEPAHMIARKLVAANLSDLAAMGAQPRWYFLGLMLPPDTSEAWLTDFASGLKTAQQEYGITLTGGDTTRALQHLGLSMTACGLVQKSRALQRNGAKPGDDVYVSGTLGDAALGLKVAKGEMTADDFPLQRYRLPQPRIALGQGLFGLASACMDISDGLMQDLEHICAASKARAEIAWPNVPLSQQAAKVLQTTDTLYETVLAGGDDYELLFTVPPERTSLLTALAARSGTKVTRIGRMVEGEGAVVLDAKGQEIALKRKGYRHF